MTISFKAISLSHARVPLTIRELFAMNSKDRQKLLQYAAKLGNIEEMLVVSTCNRFEVYFTSSNVSCRQLIGLLKYFTKEPAGDYQRYFQLYEEPLTAVNHLFRVSVGLESQILADSHIINQVKQSYQSSVDNQMAGPFLHRLLHSIFHTHKRITRESFFKDCHASVNHSVVKLVQELLPQKEATILILGTGVIGKDLVCKLAKLEYNVWVSNRTEQKSQALAAELSLQAFSLSEVPPLVPDAHLVISAMAVENPWLTSNNINLSELQGHKYFIDLSVPRSIASDLQDHPQITLLNMEDINDKISSTLHKRREEVPKVEAIINSEISGFLAWAKELKVVPTIHQMKKALEKIRKEEMLRHLKQLDLPENDLINNITKSIVAKVVKLPALKLKLACRRGESEPMIQVLNEIFNI